MSWRRADRVDSSVDQVGTTVSASRWMAGGIGGRRRWRGIMCMLFEGLEVVKCKVED